MRTCVRVYVRVCVWDNLLAFLKSSLATSLRCSFDLYVIDHDWDVIKTARRLDLVLLTQ